jgi:nucleotide-binding universal stress UspA family protein
MFKHLLVPTDGSALSEAAIQMAVTFARESGAKVTGLHVIPEFHVLAYGTEMIATKRSESFSPAESVLTTTSRSSPERPRKRVSSAIRLRRTAPTRTRR